MGIIAVTDARARQLMQACMIAGIEVPEQVAPIGIDNDPLVRMLTRIPLSSVIPGAQEMGRAAAHLIERMLHGSVFKREFGCTPRAYQERTLKDLPEPARTPHFRDAEQITDDD